MRARHGFASFLGPDIEQFIAHKRSAGRRFEVEEKTLSFSMTSCSNATCVRSTR